jgi:ParB family transcriptional regulator, chromosome partitioning protein
VSTDKPRRLGRGLEALIPGAAALAGASGQPPSELQRIPLARVRHNPYQPRRQFDPAELAELERSLQASGLLQPITVRKHGESFELVAGERRFRAATNLGWTEIPAIVRDFDDQTMLVLALVENLQRSNLNAIEEARGYRKLIHEFQFTQQQVADAIGKDRTTITNLLRVLSLPEQIQQHVESGAISLGHARALLTLSDPEAAVPLASDAITHRLSVRELEQRVRDLNEPQRSLAEGAGVGKSPKSRAGAATTDPAVKRIEDDLRRYLQTDVKIHLAVGEQGSIEVSFYSNDDLERVLELILREARRDF